MTDKKDFKVQAVLFDKTKVTLDDCFDWLVEYGFKIKKSYEDEQFYRFQQFCPAYLKRNSYTKYVTKKLNDKVSVVMCYPKEQVATLTVKPIELVEEPECVAFWVPTMIEMLCAFLTVVGFFVLSIFKR